MAKKTKLLCKSCKASMEVEFCGETALYPAYICPNGCEGPKNEWEKWWSEYFNRWETEEYWNIKKEMPTCVVSYFCHRFFKHYGYAYSFDYNSPIPFKSKEFKTARKLLLMFEGKAKIVRNYIDWVFEKRIKRTNYTLTSFGFFGLGKLVNEYNNARARKRILRRSSPLPEDFLSWCEEKYPEIFNKRELKTWNHLNGLVSYVRSYGRENIEAEIIEEAVRRKMLPSTNEYKKLEG